MIAVVPPGEHLVEVREESVEGARWVSVRAGEVVELDIRLRHTLSDGSEHAGMVRSWLPDPRLWIDGRKRPLSWATWWYQLPAGRHEVEVWLPSASTPEGADDRTVTPLTVPVDVAAGETRRLDIEVRAHSRVETGHLSLFEDGSYRFVERTTRKDRVDISTRVNVTTR